jgi:hypothetical protein
MKKRWYVLIGVLVILLAGAGVGLMMYFKPHKDFGASKSDIVVTVAEILAAFEKNEEAANARFVADDLTIEVKGNIQDISTGEKGAASIILTGSTPDGTVSCTLTPEESKMVSSLKKGDAVAIKGQCTGIQTLLDKQVILIRCALAQ